MVAGLEKFKELRDSLKRTDDDIRGYLGIMKEIFGIE